MFWNDFQQNQAVLFFLFCQMVSFLSCILLKIICDLFINLEAAFVRPVLTTGLVLSFSTFLNYGLYPWHASISLLNDAMSSFQNRIHNLLEWIQWITQHHQCSGRMHTLPLHNLNKHLQSSFRFYPVSPSRIQNTKQTSKTHDNKEPHAPPQKPS